MSLDPGGAEMARLRAEAEADALPASLGDFVRARAAEMGDALAACWFEDDISLSYCALDETADRLASSLLALGVRKGSHVGVMLPNCAAFPLTWIALARIGAVMVPVNTAYTGEEMHFVLSDSDAQYLVLDESCLAAFRAMPERPPLLADGNVVVHGAPPAAMRSWRQLAEDGGTPFAVPSPVGREDLLNLQYTSGTTGFPKGCMLSHDYWMLLSHNAARHRGSAGDVRNVLIWAPFFYMDPMWQFLMTLRLGGTAYVARRMSLSRFRDWLADLAIDYCIFPEPALKQCAPRPDDRDLPLKFVSIFGWREEARREVEARFGVVARESYGMTEIGAGTMVPQAAGEKAFQRTCGQAAPFRELRIVDEDGNDLPDGETGELWVAGRALLWGYYKRPEANAESFRGRWFRTGDLFRRDADGYYFIVGRIKDMIKRAGENIAAIEVEAALRAMPEIEEAAVVPVPDPARREEVKAYLKLKGGLSEGDVPPAAVLAHCETRLAAFKVPRYLAYMTGDFPRTPSRKIAKKQLVEGVADLRDGAYDRVDEVWR